jgi:SAM-dependent methyltransferase
MDIAAYAVEADIEAGHWWFAGRRVLFSNIIKKFKLPADADILDVGTSTGTNLRLLRDLGFTRITGVDQSPVAIQFCADKGLGQVKLGEACALPFPDASFDLVLATDIIEHVDDDVRALAELRRVLKPGQPLLLTVPAFPVLWGLQDEVSHHKRRYRLNQLLEKLASAGLSPQRHFYFNYLLFLPILAARRLMRILKLRVAAEGQINTEFLNRLLTLLFRIDVQTAPRLRPPIGVSALVIATRNETSCSSRGSEHPPPRASPTKASVGGPRR